MFLKSLIMPLVKSVTGNRSNQLDPPDQNGLNEGWIDYCTDYYCHFDDAPVPYLIIDEEGLILQTNQAASALLTDLSGSPSKGETLDSYIYSEDRNKFNLYRKQMLKMGGRISREVQIINRSGELSPVIIKMTALGGRESEQERFGVVLLDIGESKLAAETLAKQVETEKIIASISTIFVNQPSDQIADGINYSLMQTGLYLGADYSMLFLFEAEGKKIRFTNGWSNDGNLNLPERYKVIEAESYPWFVKGIAANEIINISSLSELPAEAMAEYGVLKENALKTVLAIPVVSENRAIGFVFYTAEKEIAWADRHIYLLMVVSELLSSALVKQQSKIVLQKSEARYRWLLETLQEGVWGIDSAGLTNYVNKPMAEMLRFSEDEMLGKSLLDFMDEEERVVAIQKMQQRARGEKEQHEFVFRRKDGTKFHALLITGPIYDEKGLYKGAIAGVQDIGEIKKNEELLKYKLKFEELVSGISGDFIGLPAEQVDRGVNEALKIIGEFFHFDRSYIMQNDQSSSIMSITHEWCADGVSRQIDRIKNTPVESFPWWAAQLKRDDYLYIHNLDDLPPEAEAEKEEFRWQEIESLLMIPLVWSGQQFGALCFDAVGTTAKWPDSNISLLKIVAEIISSAFARYEAEEKIRYLSFHDSLTGLFNRAYLEEEMHRLDKSRQLPISIIMADLNNLKYLNDNFGHDAGDRALIKTADILRESCRSEDIVGRWGGDEFIMLLPQISEQGVKKRIEMIRELCRDEQIEGNPLSFALGAVVKEKSGQDLIKFLKLAEEVMYLDKRSCIK